MILSFFYSNKYLNFLEKVLGIEINRLDSDLKFNYAIYSGKKGKVINGLPFFGSFGGPVYSDGQNLLKLNETIEKLIHDHTPLTFFFIENPFYEIDERIFLKFKVCDSRVFQWTDLVSDSNSLFERIASSARRNIKKALRNGISIGWDSLDYNDNMIFHKNNMHNKNVKAKPKKFYEELKSHFEYGSDYRIYYAYSGISRIASLLLFYHNETVEYFIPSYDSNYLSLEPMSLLIYEAMKDAISMSFKYWSWGGISKDAISVYNYKKKWDTKELKYRYFIYNDIDRIRNLSQKDLSEYSYFYVYPFNKNLDEL